MSNIDKNMKNGKFETVAAKEGIDDWEKLIERLSILYSRSDDIRTEFARDYTRILHSMAYRRLKHKTQVFFNINNDHICTRMEHVSHVESVSYTIAKKLGLNCELTKAIAVGHDLGHAPFGHQGETVIKELSKEYLNEDFWHEKNGYRFVEKIELLEDNYKVNRNLNLTYAVRDGIISHCGEVDENGIHPRKDLFNLSKFNKAGEYQPSTWEGCVVKLSDKIAYIGRDIEDAINLGFLDVKQQRELLRMAQKNDQHALNTTVIMHNLIINVCENSDPENGITMSKEFVDQLNELKDFNYENIYRSKRLEPFKKYSNLVIKQIFEILRNTYEGERTFILVEERLAIYPNLLNSFSKWLARYCDISIIPDGELKEIALNCENEKIYEKLQFEHLFFMAILDYISGMTDSFAIKVFNELLTY